MRRGISDLKKEGNQACASLGKAHSNSGQLLQISCYECAQHVRGAVWMLMWPQQ